MKKIAAVLFIVSANGLLPGQVPNVAGKNPLVERAERVKRSFPPDVIAPVKISAVPLTSRRYCVSAPHDGKVISFHACPTPVKRAPAAIR